MPCSVQTQYIRLRHKYAQIPTQKKKKHWHTHTHTHIRTLHITQQITDTDTEKEHRHMHRHKEWRNTDADRQTDRQARHYISGSANIIYIYIFKAYTFLYRVSNADEGTKEKKETEKGRQKSGGKKCKNSPMSHSPSTFTCPQVGLSAGHVGLSRPNTCVTRMAKITITIVTVFFYAIFFSRRQAGRHAPYTCRLRSAVQSLHVA
jgi:hypothetical protein